MFSPEQLTHLKKFATILVDDGDNVEYTRGICELIAEFDGIEGVDHETRSEQIRSEIIIDITAESTKILEEKSKVVSVVEIDYRDFESVIEKFFEVLYYNVVATEEGSNDSTMSFGPYTKTKLDEYDWNELLKFKGGRDVTFITSNLVQEMVNNDVFPENTKLIVNVHW